MKYPHTPYFRFSPSAKKDRRASGVFDLTNFLNEKLVITVKMDGSNCCFTHDKVVARNGISANQTSFDFVKQLHAGIRDHIPMNYRIYGENLYAEHSISYRDALALDGYFQVFAIFDVNTNWWLSWPSVQYVASELGLPSVPEFATYPPCDNLDVLEETIALEGEDCIARGHEGIVVRKDAPIYSASFKNSVAKYVRANHVQTDEHWMNKPIVRNVLVSSDRKVYI